MGLMCSSQIRGFIRFGWTLSESFFGSCSELLGEKFSLNMKFRLQNSESQSFEKSKIGLHHSAPIFHGNTSGTDEFTTQTYD